MTAIELRLHEKTAYLTLACPARRNLLSRRMRTDLARALDEVPGEARALVLTGAGSAFCIGHDLEETGAASGRQAGDILREEYAPILERLRTLPIPTLAAVNGPAIGAGVSLALACDLVIARNRAFFALPQAGLGILPDAGVLQLLTRRVGEARAMLMAMAGERVSAPRAVEWGLIAKSAPNPEYGKEIERCARALAGLRPGTGGMIRDLLDQAARSEPGAFLAREARAQQAFMEAPAGGAGAGPA